MGIHVVQWIKQMSSLIFLICKIKLFMIYFREFVCGHHSWLQTFGSCKQVYEAVIRKVMGIHDSPLPLVTGSKGPWS